MKTETDPRSTSQRFAEDHGGECTCYITAPCSLCIDMTKDEHGAWESAGIGGLRTLWRSQDRAREAAEALADMDEYCADDDAAALADFDAQAEQPTRKRLTNTEADELQEALYIHYVIKHRRASREVRRAEEAVRAAIAKSTALALVANGMESVLDGLGVNVADLDARACGIDDEEQAAQAEGSDA